jgi:hypothetical protein
MFRRLLAMVGHVEEVGAASEESGLPGVCIGVLGVDGCEETTGPGCIVARGYPVDSREVGAGILLMGGWRAGEGLRLAELLYVQRRPRPLLYAHACGAAAALEQRPRAVQRHASARRRQFGCRRVSRSCNL